MDGWCVDDVGDVGGGGINLVSYSRLLRDESRPPLPCILCCVMFLEILQIVPSLYHMFQ